MTNQRRESVSRGARHACAISPAASPGAVPPGLASCGPAGVGSCWSQAVRIRRGDQGTDRPGRQGLVRSVTRKRGGRSPGDTGKRAEVRGRGPAHLRAARTLRNQDPCCCLSASAR
ncbi:hypothetical protein NN561_014722 [Cricetulus griseus]